MAGKLKEAVLKDVRALITKLSGFQEEEDNFKLCERFILSNAVHHRYLSVDSHHVRRSLDGITEKLSVHGLFDKAQEFEGAYKKFLALKEFEGHETVDIQWGLLSLLLQLADNPTGSTSTTTDEVFPVPAPAVVDHGEIADWAAYLREGEEEFQCTWDEGSESEDEVDCFPVSVAPSPLVFKTSHTPKQSPPPSPFLGTFDSLTPLKQKTSVDTKQQRARSVRQAVASETWLKNNIQCMWWSKPHTEHVPQSNHLSSKVAHVWDKRQISTLSEHKVVLDVLWFLAVPADTAVFMEVIHEDGVKSSFCVRPHITIPSLTQDVFSSLIMHFCLLADKVKDMQLFCQGVYANEKYQVASHTYQAYAAVLQNELNFFLESISALETRAHKQESTLTLQMVVEEMRPWCNKIESLHGLHQQAVLDWKKYPNWLCATHLLSVLLFSLRMAGAETGMFLRMFIKTFAAYLNIIDQWHTGGQLYDWRNEFFISRSKKGKGIVGAVFVKRDWEQELLARGVEPPMLLRGLADCLLQSAQPLDVLFQMERLSELRKRTSERGTLYCRFLQSILSQLEGFQREETSGSGDQSLEDPWWKQLDKCLILDSQVKEGETTNKTDTPGDSEVDVASIMTHLQRFEDPFLEKDFQTFINHLDKNQKNIGSEENEEQGMVHRLLQVTDSLTEILLPLECCLERVVYHLSADWAGVAGTMAADILVREQRLLQHMHIAQSVFLLQAAHKLQPFISHLFKLLLQSTGAFWTSSHTLSVLLQDCMDADQLSVLITPTNKNVSDMTVLDCIDCINLHYQVEWPLCDILGDKNENSYNALFRFLLKLQWGLWMLEKLNLANMAAYPNSNSESVERLLYLRFWLMHMLRGAYSFLAGHVNASWLKFENDIRLTKDLLSIVVVHDRFLDSALQQSLQAGKQDAVKSALFQLVVLAEKLHSTWSEGTEKINCTRLSNMEECFVSCHLFLATALQTLAQEDGQQHLAFLNELFNRNIPIRRDE